MAQPDTGKKTISLSAVPPGQSVRDFLQANRLDLNGAELPAAQAAHANLRHAQMRNADLRGAVLIGADLTGADLTGANLEGAYLEGAILTNAHISNANLHRADLHNATFDGARMAKTNLEEARLTATTWAGAMVVDANLRHAVLFDANEPRPARKTGTDPTQGAVIVGCEYHHTKGVELYPAFRKDHADEKTAVTIVTKPAAFLAAGAVHPPVHHIPGLPDAATKFLVHHATSDGLEHAMKEVADFAHKAKRALIHSTGLHDRVSETTGALGRSIDFLGQATGFESGRRMRGALATVQPVNDVGGVRLRCDFARADLGTRIVARGGREISCCVDALDHYTSRRGSIGTFTLMDLDASFPGRPPADMPSAVRLSPFGARATYLDDDARHTRTLRFDRTGNPLGVMTPSGTFDERPATVAALPHFTDLARSIRDALSRDHLSTIDLSPGSAVAGADAASRDPKIALAAMPQVLDDVIAIHKTTIRHQKRNGAELSNDDYSVQECHRAMALQQELGKVAQTLASNQPIALTRDQLDRCVRDAALAMRKTTQSARGSDFGRAQELRAIGNAIEANAADHRYLGMLTAPARPKVASKPPSER